MNNLKIPPGLITLLQKADFVSVGTSDEHGQPSVASKFLLKVDGGNLYFVDLVKGKIWRNLQYNPFISLTVMDEDNLRNYQINGTAKVLDAGSEFDLLMREFEDKQVSFATNKIIAGVRQFKPHQGIVFSSSQAKVFYKIAVHEVLEIGPLVRLKTEEANDAQEILPIIVGFKSRFIKRARYFTEKNKWLTMSAAFILILIIECLDYFAGPDIELSILLLFPLIAVVISMEKKAALIIMYTSVVGWIISEEASRGWHFPWGIMLWNALIRLGYFFLIINLVYVLKNKMKKEQELARSDFLTGIANARHFSYILAMELKRLARDGRPFTLAYFDVDNFKSVNDFSGHKAGDVLLRLIAETLKRSIREMDVVGRLGGDEFALLMPLTDQAQARFVLGRARDALLASLGGQGYGVTFSIGAVTYLSAVASSDEAITLADNKMYEAKKHGKNSIRYGVFGEQRRK